MRQRIRSIAVLVLPLVAASGCDGGEASGRPESPPLLAAAHTRASGAPAGGDGCALPAIDAWVGTAAWQTIRPGGDTDVLATVRFTRASTDGCIDRYMPSGTASQYRHGFDCTPWIYEPASTAIGAGDGELVIDRTARPARYELSGATTWTATGRCWSGPPGPARQIGGAWAGSSGVFDGAVLAAGMSRPGESLTWTLFAAGAVFTPPGDACSEPSSEEWRSVASWEVEGGALVVTATWTRISTIECADLYAPAGTAEMQMADTETCSPLTFDPGVIAPRDGTLIIDRATDPATYFISGTTRWDSTRRCTLPDGTVETEVQATGGEWALALGVFDGDRFGAEWSPARWELERVR